MLKKIAFVVVLIVLYLYVNAPVHEARAAVDGQEKVFELQKIPDSLEGMLASALKSSPEIQVAEADLLHAKASVKQVRLQVSQAVVEVHHDLRLQQAREEGVMRELQRYQTLQKSGQVGSEAEADLLQAMTEARAGIARCEAMLCTLLGYEFDSEEAGKKLPKQLEKQLTRAFDDNSEIVLAEAALARMQAGLHQMRCKVTQQVTEAFQMRRVKRHALDMAAKQLVHFQERIEKGLLAKEEEMVPLQAMIEAEAELMQVEAHIRYLTGLGGVIKTKKTEEAH